MDEPGVQRGTRHRSRVATSTARSALRLAEAVARGRAFVDVATVGVRAVVVLAAGHVVDAARQLRLHRVRGRAGAVDRFDPRRLLVVRVPRSPAWRSRSWRSDRGAGPAGTGTARSPTRHRLPAPARVPGCARQTAYARPASMPANTARLKALRIHGSFHANVIDGECTASRGWPSSADGGIDEPARAGRLSGLMNKDLRPNTLPAGPPPYLGAGAHRCSRFALRASGRRVFRCSCIPAHRFPATSSIRRTRWTQSRSSTRPCETASSRRASRSTSPRSWRSRSSSRASASTSSRPASRSRPTATSNRSKRSRSRSPGPIITGAVADRRSRTSTGRGKRCGTRRNPASTCSSRRRRSTWRRSSG